ncbi:MAG: HEAT repeat domain-containing protein [Elusimicrobia bacterium]|nr:HEAT repeat domain-containing protein [Elusimicrobiota bacterium]
MRKAWLFGVLLLSAQAAAAGTGGIGHRDLSLLLHAGELPPIAAAPAAGTTDESLRDALSPAQSLGGFLAVLREPDPRGRGEAVEAIGYRGNFAAIPYVSAVLLRLDETLFVRVAAAQALGRIGDRRAWSFLLRALKDRQPQVRLASAMALGRLMRRRGAGSLARALGAERDAGVRAALSWALSEAQDRP